MNGTSTSYAAVLIMRTSGAPGKSMCAWGPPPLRGFFRPDGLAELMMKGDGR